MKISVIIPTCQPKDYIYKCLQSVFDQSLPRDAYNVFLIINGDKEPYFSDISTYLDNNNHGVEYKIIHTGIAGVSNARNIGIENSDGQYIAFIDDDDWISRNYLEALLLKASGKSIAQSNVMLIDEKTKRELPYYLSQAFYHHSHKKKTGLFADRHFLSSAWSKLIHRSMIGHVRFRSDLAYGEDAFFMFQISKNMESITVTEPETIYYVRYRKDSVSHRKITFAKNITLHTRLTKQYFSIYLRHVHDYNLWLFISRIVATFMDLFRKIRQDR